MLPACAYVHVDVNREGRNGEAGDKKDFYFPYLSCRGSNTLKAGDIGYKQMEKKGN